MQQYIVSFIVFILTIASYSQSITAKLIDKNKNPIPFAAIQTSENNGVISNEEGVFTLDLKNNSITNISISCLGYITRDLSIKYIKKTNYIIVLKEALNQLDEVYLTNKTPNADSIIKRVIANISENYNFDNNKYNFFYRNTEGFDFKKLNFDVDKASGFKKKTLEKANYSLDSMTNVIINSKSVHFTDAIGDLYVKNKDTAKLKLEKVTKLLDKKKNFSIENTEEKAKAILFKYLDASKSYKLKSGLFKIEDSLTFQDVKKKEKEKKADSLTTKYFRQNITGQLKKSNLNLKKRLRNFLNIELYDYEYVDIVSFNNQLIHVIKFNPDKAKAKFSGTLYITDDTYAITRVDYAFAKGKRGQKFNLRLLLGVKFIDNYRKGTIIFKKQQDTYVPKYLAEEEGQYVYMHRPIKFIENGTRKKVSFDVLIEGNIKEKTELLFNNTQAISTDTFKEINEPKRTKFTVLKKWNPEIWKDYNVLEPLEEMKNFKVETIHTTL